MKKRLLSILLTACLALSLCTGLSGTLQVQAADESSIHINDLVQVQVGESLTDLKVYRNGVYETMVSVESGTYTATVFINGAATDMTTTFTADAAGEVCLRVKDNALTQVAIQSCALVGNFDGLNFVDEAGKPFDIGLWEPEDPDAELTYLGGGLYGRTFRFQALEEDITIAGTGYRVAFNDRWDYSIGDGSDNIALTIPAGSSSLTVLVDEINQVVYDSVRSGSFSVAQGSGAIALPALATTVSLIGTVRNGNDWSVAAKDYEFDLISDTLYRYEKTLEAGTCNYKCVFDYRFWYAESERTVTLAEKTHVVFLYDTVTGRLYDTVNDYNAVAELIGMQAPPAQTKISAKYLDENGEEQTAFCDAAITADNIGSYGTLNAGWYVVRGEVTASSGITVTGDVHLILADHCSLTVENGLTAEGNLTIYAQSTGDAKGCMHVAGPDIEGSDSRSCGIELRGNLTINGGSIIAEGGDANVSSGIYVTERNAGNNAFVGGYIVIHGGSIIAEGGDANSSCGIDVKYDLIMTGGILTAIGSGAETMSIGVIVRSLIISGGTITGAGGDADELSAGILTDSKLTITGSTVTATGGSAKISYGIYDVDGEYSSSMSVSEQANVIAIGGNGETRSYGIFTEGKITIESATVNATGGSVTATGGNVDTWSYGIFAENNITIEDATVNATGGTATGGNGETVSYGIRAGIDLTIDGGTVTATGNDAETLSYGIYADNNLRIDGGHVTAQTLAETATTKAALSKEPILNGYTDYYWRTDAEGSYTKGNFIWKDAPYDTYVEFTDSFTITLDPNFDGGESGTMTTGTDGKLTELLPVLTRDGYTFDGWFTEATGGEKVTNETVFNGYVTIYAHWTAKSSGGSSTPTYPPTVTKPENGSVTVSPKSPRKGVTVTITPKPEAGYTVEQILVTDKNGDPVEVINNGDGTYSFTQPAGKVNINVTFMEDNSMLNFFVDVFPGDYYYDAVLWAAENGITGGVDDTHFAPNATCTRAQAVTFLWRAAGCPAPQSNAMPFTDVAEGSYYHDAVLWAVENGITKGTSDTAFSPNATCTRAQIMTFIYRSEQAQGGGMQGAWMFQNPFSDVDLESYYGEAVMWAVANGVTSGTSDTTFSPNANCTRAQIVTFLYRCFVK